MELAKKRTFWGKCRDSETWGEFKKSKTAIIASAMLLIILLTALIGPWFTAQNPYDIGSLNLVDAYKPPVWMEGGDPRFPLGTDQQGRCILSAMVYGSRVSLFVGIVGVLLSGIVGICLGLLAGCFGGAADSVIMRVADIQLSFPSMLIALFLMNLLGRGIGNILISITLVGWVRYARTVRAEALSVKSMEYVDAMRVVGLSNLRIAFKHILPNVLTSIIVLSTIQVGSFILLEASLSFLGLGVPVVRPSLGMLCSDGFKVLYSGLWWVSVFPGLYIVLIVFSINLLGDFLRDAFNPKLK